MPGLGQVNGFAPAYVVSLLRLVKKKAQQNSPPAREECDKYDLTAVFPVFDWLSIMIGPGGLLLVVPTYLKSQFQFYGWSCKRVNN